MTSDVTTVVYVGHVQTASEERALSAWAKKVGLVLGAPKATGTRELTVDFRLGGQIDAGLKEARESMQTQDREGTDAALERTRLLIEAHPELPQAAFLRAEYERLRATRLHRIAPISDLEAAKAWLRARSLDGGRMRALGEDVDELAPAMVRTTFTWSKSTGDRAAEATIFLDGRLVDAGSRELPAGPHHLRILERGVLRIARWLEITDAAQVTLEMPPPAACGRDDFGDDAPHPAVTCPRWLAVRRTERGMSVARCAGPRCGSAVEVESERHREALLPGWIGWALVGVAGAAAAGLSVLAATRTPPPPPGAFVNGGIAVENRR